MDPLGEMTSINKRTIIELSQALEYVVPTLMENWAGVDKRGLGPLFVRFSEIWAAKHLINFGCPGTTWPWAKLAKVSSKTSAKNAEAATKPHFLCGSVNPYNLTDMYFG